jgi:hypothetical protein
VHCTSPDLAKFTHSLLQVLTMAVSVVVAAAVLTVVGSTAALQCRENCPTGGDG